MKLIRRLKLRWHYWNRFQKWEHPLYREYLYWKDRFIAWRKSLILKRAIKLAKARHKADGKTYYVIPDDRNRPRAFNNREIEILKKSRLMSKKVTCLDLYKEAMFIANYQTCKKILKNSGS